MSLEEFVRRALREVAKGSGKAIDEGPTAWAYTDRVVFEVQVDAGSDGDGLYISRAETARGRLTFTVMCDLGEAPFPASEK